MRHIQSLCRDDPDLHDFVCGGDRARARDNVYTTRYDPDRFLSSCGVKTYTEENFVIGEAFLDHTNYSRSPDDTR